MPLLNLANELFLIIAEGLALADLNSLAQTCHRLNSLLSPYLTKYITQNKHALLPYAAEKGYEWLVKRVIEEGANINNQDEYGKTALVWAIQKSHDSILQLLLDSGAGINAKANIFTPRRVYTTPIHPLLLATEFENDTISDSTMKLLLEGGAEVNYKNEYRHFTALHWAAHTGKESKAELLLKYGADVSGRASFDGYECTPLYMAAASGFEGMVTLLLKGGADINARGNTGSTALHAAAAKGKVGMVKLLLENGSDITTLDDMGQNALHYAGGEGQDEVVKLLLEKGIDANAKDLRKFTALHRVAFNGRYSMSRYGEVVRLLLEKGADIAARDITGAGALHRAVYSENTSIIDILLDKGADIASKDDKGRTALHDAAILGRVKVAEALLEKGADIASRDNDGRNVLHTIAYSWPRSYDLYVYEQNVQWPADGWGSIVKLFLARGLDVTAKDNNGSTALEIAAENGWQELACILRDYEAGLSVEGYRV